MQIESASPQPSWIFCVCCMDTCSRLLLCTYQEYFRRKKYVFGSIFILDYPNLPGVLLTKPNTSPLRIKKPILYKGSGKSRPIFRRIPIFDSADKEHLESNGRMHIPAGCPAHPPVNPSEDEKTALLARSRSPK